MEKKMPPPLDSHQHYIEYGFAILDTNLKTKILLLKEQWINLFNIASTENGGPPIKTDIDIIYLYENHKELWIAAYDQIRQLLSLYNLLDEEHLSKICSVAGIKLPAYTCQISTRIDMPNGEGSQPAPAHQDYPTHQGSSNSITVWYPLQDTFQELGPIQILPKSHLNGFHPDSLTQGKNEFTSPGSLKRTLNYQPTPGYLSADIKIGQILVFSTMLFHQSGVNTSKDKIRYSVQLRLNDLNNTEYAKRKFYLNVQHKFKKIVTDAPINFSM